MAQLSRRQNVNNDPNSPDYCPWWYCDQTAYIVKWVVVGVIFILIMVFIMGGYWHAKKRMARGQAPLRYHRWLISRQARERFFPHHPAQNSYNFYRPAYGHGSQAQPQSYPMQNYGYPPPPAYNEYEHVPAYTPASKVNPDQSYAPPQPGFNPAAGSSNLQVSGPSQPARTASPANNNK